MTCQTCGNENQEAFCPNCGEKRFNPHSLSVKHVVEESFEGFTHADHNLLRTGAALLFKPGQLTTEYVAGRRVRFMKPLGLFLVINLLFFLFARNNAFNQPLRTFLDFDNYTMFGTQQAVEHVLASTGQKMEQFEKGFNESMRASSKSYVIVLIPLYALIFGLLMIRSRRSPIEHLIFATHFICFVLLFLLMYTFIVQTPLIWIFGEQGWKAGGDTITALAGMIIIGVYLAVAFKKFYYAKKPWTIAASVISTLLFAGVIVGYRMFLFYKIVALAHG